MICWHYDDTQGRDCKGINFLTALYHSEDVSLPVAFDLVAKTEAYLDEKSGKLKRGSKTTRMTTFARMLRVCVHNGISFRYVLNDSWYAAADNMLFIRDELARDFIMALKSNVRGIVCSRQRSGALSESEYTRFTGRHGARNRPRKG